MLTHPYRIGLIGVAAVLALSLFTACGGGSTDTSAPARSEPSPAMARTGGGLPTSGAASGSSTSGSESTVATSSTTSDPVSAITIIAMDNAYAPAEFRIRAGSEVSVTVENHGQALHDWRVRGVQNAEGKDTGTKLLQKGQSEVMAITIGQPGDYAFYCEVHPAEMRGRLIVE